jgi:mannose-6-phosphate isomerase-like protein (cupin superfamily)
MSVPDTYPDPVYLGEPGLANARLRRSDAAPEIRQANGGAAAYLATGASTNGQFGLYRWDMAAAPSGPGPHFHRTISESFYVLSGTIRLFDGTDWIDGHAGDFLFVPEGGLHGFRNESGAPAAMLILFAPGAPREDYFETTAALGHGLKLSDEEKAAFYVRHDTYWR